MADANVPQTPDPSEQLVTRSRQFRRLVSRRQKLVRKLAAIDQEIVAQREHIRHLADTESAAIVGGDTAPGA